MQQAARDLEPPLHAARELLDELVARRPRVRRASATARSLGTDAAGGRRGRARRAAPCSPTRSGRRRGWDPGRRCRTGCRTSFWLPPGIEPVELDRAARGRQQVVSIWMVVVLPAPLGPRKAKISPATSNETLLTAVKSRRCGTRSWTRMAGSDTALILNGSVQFVRIAPPGAGPGSA